MPRVEGLAWRNPFLEQSVQKIVLAFEFHDQLCQAAFSLEM
jgi:hypothetical protein